MIGSGTSNEVQHLDIEQAALARTCAILFVEHLAKENVKAEHQNEVQHSTIRLKMFIALSKSGFRVFFLKENLSSSSTLSPLTSFYKASWL